ncbi:hypothetical protein CJF32_00008289 [Rutstroemia sp. NJR-2017a WRK4]|nr:hypothetical protein CJF32_00008289 [Rutstroemia sp. NJR-2017a WRK4]
MSSSINIESGDGIVSSAGAGRDLLSPPRDEYQRTHARSLSVPRSEVSIISHKTLVEENAEFVANHQGDPDHNESDNKNNHHHLRQKPKRSALDFLKTIFCMRVSESMSVSENIGERGRSDSGLTEEQMPSPWIHHVYVLAARHDTQNHPVPKSAVCTIDTGNMQGNLVSRELVNRLGYSESNIRDLTQAERRGAVGITNDKLIPEGAIYLTWYHKRGTRVFHNMRFLISPHPHADLVIGAQSILKYDLVTAPNFMSGAVPNDGGTIAVNTGIRDKELDARRAEVVDLEEKIGRIKADITNESRKRPNDARRAKIEGYKKELQICEKKLVWAETRHLIRKAQVENPDNKEKLLTTLENKLKESGYQPEEQGGVQAEDKKKAGEKQEKTTAKDEKDKQD